jgi:CBS domain-containing protein
MTKDPVCCLPNDTVAEAAELMKDENIGSITIVENKQNQKLVRIVTDSDLALTIVVKGRDAKSTPVKAVMTRELVTCLADVDLQKALDAMAEHSFLRIPAMNRNNKIVRIINWTDVATRVDEPAKTAEVIKEISHANGK